MGGAAGHMNHPFDLSWVNTGDDLIDFFERAKAFVEDKGAGAVKIDGVNVSFKVVETERGHEFAVDRGSLKNIEDKYNVGDVHNCKIKNSVNNGVFLALDDNIEGFLHNNDISWTRKIKSINDFTNSDNLEVKILDVSAKDKKIALSHKHMSEDPWENIDTHIKLNETYKAKILFKLDKSIICLFNDSFEGVIQITNDNHDFAKNIKNNDEVSISVVDVNSEKRKLSLDFADMSEVSVINDESADGDDSADEEKISNEDKTSENDSVNDTESK